MTSSRWLSGLVVLVVISCVPAAPVPCTECDGACVDLQNDARHCGTCGHACGGGQVCTAGACVTTCASGATVCGGACVDLQSSPANCGTCGTACPSGQVCSGGTCTSLCSAPRTDCSGACVDLQSSPTHCGQCGKACVAGEVCLAGTCTALCPSPKQVCNGECVDLQSSPQHCGQCGQPCATGTACVAGQCASFCPLPRRTCGTDCVDLQSDPAHCGDCATPCANGQVCSAGTCKATCDAPLQQCGSACVDVTSDRQHCGSCATTCGTNQVCIGRACTLNCPTPLSTCAVGDAGVCVDTRSDPQNCGGCGTTCDGGYCQSGSCQPTCGAGLAECNMACVSLAWDPANCGACGRHCATNLCAAGTCVDRPEQDLQLVTRTVDGGLIGVAGTDSVAVSATGQYVLFVSSAPFIVPEVTATPPSPRLYVRDVRTGRVDVPRRLDGGIDVVWSTADLSSSGRELAVMSSQADLAPVDTNGGYDGVVFNLDSNRRELVTLTSAGAQVPNSEGLPIFMFGDGRYVVFWSRSNYAVAGGEFRAYQRDRVIGETIELSPEGVAYSGGCAGGFSGSNSATYDLSPSKNVIIWDTGANYAGVDTNNCNDVQVRNRVSGARSVASSMSDGGLAAAIVGRFSGNGRFLSDTRVLFTSTLPLVTPDVNGAQPDFFVKDLGTGALTRLDFALDGGQPNGVSTYAGHALSADRRYLVFESTATNLVPGDTNGKKDCFEYDFATGFVRRINQQLDGGEATDDCLSPHVSDDGHFATFSTAAPLVPDDGNGVVDAYLQRLR
ncbi:MAG: MXAN_6577-like cysteine-rich protein [Myxococcaceae bacterium]